MFVGFGEDEVATVVDYFHDLLETNGVDPMEAERQFPYMRNEIYKRLVSFKIC